jgi:hypothetical protein
MEKNKILVLKSSQRLWKLSAPLPTTARSEKRPQIGLCALLEIKLPIIANNQQLGGSEFLKGSHAMKNGQCILNKELSFDTACSEIYLAGQYLY